MMPRVLAGHEIPGRRAFGGSPAEVTADGHVALPGGCCRRPVCDFGTLSRAPRGRHCIAHSARTPCVRGCGHSPVSRMDRGVEWPGAPRAWGGVRSGLSAIQTAVSAGKNGSRSSVSSTTTGSAHFGSGRSSGWIGYGPRVGTVVSPRIPRRRAPDLQLVSRGACTRTGVRIPYRGGDLARGPLGPADRGAVGAVRGAARRRPGHRLQAGRQGGAVHPCRRHQGLEPDAT